MLNTVISNCVVEKKVKASMSSFNWKMCGIVYAVLGLGLHIYESDKNFIQILVYCFTLYMTGVSICTYFHHSLHCFWQETDFLGWANNHRPLCISSISESHTVSTIKTWTNCKLTLVSVTFCYRLEYKENRK